MTSQPLTLTRYILSQQQVYPGATGELSVLLTQIGLAAKIISRELSRLGFGALWGESGETNVQGEEVKRLDQFANETFIHAFGHSGLVCTLISEEMEKPLHLSENCPHAKYTLLYDPIDGSASLDVNGAVGSVFSIYRRPATGDHTTPEANLRPGVEQVIAGYVLYGPGTMLVYADSQGVQGFTLDRGIGEFLLSHERIRIPAKGKTYSVNEGHSRFWHADTRAFVDYLKQPDSATGRPYSARYIGAFVADFHRTLLSGGVFLYPADTANPKKPTGKLRLMYEINPMALIAERAGGRASTGTGRVLEIVPTSLHQRAPVIIGSSEDVAVAERFARGAAPA
ncbi:MAG TPA: class 1 fructose-bisphosphatase [Nitrospiria bacterium]|nr:class 1 fructose-bisphosphatase [Nitrospiria bacterium]